MKQKSHKHSIDKIKFQGNPLSLVHHFWPSISRLSPGLSHTELSWASGFAQGHLQKPQGGDGAVRGQVPHGNREFLLLQSDSFSSDTGRGAQPMVPGIPKGSHGSEIKV